MEERACTAVYFSCTECIPSQVALGLIGSGGSWSALVGVCGRGCGCEWTVDRFSRGQTGKIVIGVRRPSASLRPYRRQSVMSRVSQAPPRPGSKEATANLHRIPISFSIYMFITNIFTSL